MGGDIFQEMLIDGAEARFFIIQCYSFTKVNGNAILIKGSQYKLPLVSTNEIAF